MNCRFCGQPNLHRFVDLGSAPFSNAYLQQGDLDTPEVYYPLRALVCPACWLVQIEGNIEANKIFTADYSYFSSTSLSWLQHATEYSNMICSRLGIDKSSFVLEIASNDGYLLKEFVARGIPCLGIEPTRETATVAEKAGVPTLREFFNNELAIQLANQGRQADLIIGNNVYAHVPDIGDFTRGLKAALKPGGTINLEFPHLMRLIQNTQFDTIYHEHYSYLSLHTVALIFTAAGLRIFDLEELPSHGGSLRIYGCHTTDPRQQTEAVAELLEKERLEGLRELVTYSCFQKQADQIKYQLPGFLMEQKQQDRTIAAYGAAAKGNTLLNYCGIKPDLIPYVCDAAPSKQGKFLPGSRIPIVAPSELRIRRPEMVLILPWNITSEIIEQHGYIREWGGEFVVAIPELEVLR